jgi:hypothetical protein
MGFSTRPRPAMPNASLNLQDTVIAHRGATGRAYEAGQVLNRFGDSTVKGMAATGQAGGDRLPHYRRQDFTSGEGGLRLRFGDLPKTVTHPATVPIAAWGDASR